MHAKIHSVVRHTNHVRTITLCSKEEILYKPGQYTVLRRSGEDVGRYFSFSSSLTETHPSITIKDQLESQESKYSIGDDVYVSEPQGKFTLSNNKDTPIIFVSGGIGIAPVRGLVKWLSDIGDRRNVSLFYSVRRRKDLLFLDVFKNYPVKLKITVTGTGADHEERRICTDDIVKLSNKNASLIYISGSYSMVQNIGFSLISKGVNKETIITDIPLKEAYE
jgi:ferredoxin-NADP reductase